MMVDPTYLKREEATPRGAQGGEGRGEVAEDPLMEWEIIIRRTTTTDKQTTNQGGKLFKRTLTDLTQKGWIRS